MRSSPLTLPQTALRALRASRDCQAILGVVSLALVLRLATSYWSEGSVDVVLWQRFARLVAEHGVAKVYALEPSFNHPPLAGYLGVASMELAEALGVRFSVVFKLPMIFASVALILLLWHGRGMRAGTLLLLALNPLDVLISGFHGNTDCLCSALSVLSAYLLEKGRPGLSGLALAGALNVKLIPVVLVLPFLLSLRGHGAFRFLLGVSSGIVPFVPVLVQEAPSVLRNIVGYQSFVNAWGVNLFMIASQQQLPELATWLYLSYRPAGKYLILVASLAVGLVSRRWHPWNAYELGALSFSIFLVLAPGFGAQYLVYPTGFLFASRLRVAVEYSLLASPFVVLLYFWTSPEPGPLRLFPFLPGLLAWYVLLRYVVAEAYGAIRRKRRPSMVPPSARGE